VQADLEPSAVLDRKRFTFLAGRQRRWHVVL
jgi:hypothetical protein